MKSVSINNVSCEIKFIKIEMTALDYVKHLIETSQHFKNGCIMPEVTTVKWFGEVYKIYRFVYAVLKGDIPPHTLVMHSCDNNPCINIEHLNLGTHSQNSSDAKKRGPSEFLRAYNHVRYGNSI